MNASPTSVMAVRRSTACIRLPMKFHARPGPSNQFYAEFLRFELPSDPAAQFDRHAWPQLRTKISDAFAARPQREWAKIFSDSDACVAPVLGMADAPGHPQLVARKPFRRQWHNPAVPGPPVLAHSGSRRRPAMRAWPAHRRSAR